MDPALQYLLLCFATAACATIVAKMKIAKPLHDLAERLGQVWLQDLLLCPYCLSFLFGLLFVLLTGTGGSPLGVVFLVPAVAAGAVIVMGVMTRLHFTHERELHGVRTRLSEANEALANAEFELREARIGEGEARVGEDEAHAQVARIREEMTRLQTTSSILLKENARLRQSVWDAERERTLGKTPGDATKTQGRLNHEHHFGPADNDGWGRIVATPEIVPANGFTPPRPMPPAPAPEGWEPVPDQPETGSAP